MKNIAYHLIGRLYGCNPKQINNKKFIKEVLIKSAKKGKLKIVKSISYHHRIANGKHQGISAVVIVEESHIGCYTWPEHQYCLVDILTCGDEKSARKVLHNFISELSPKEMRTMSEAEVV